MKKQLPIVWEPMNYLYVHINKTNGKKYFGITSQKPRQRWNKGEKYKRGQSYLYNAIQKYGWDGFYHIVIFQNLDRFMACELEKYFIDKYKTTNGKYGYNQTLGGDHFFASDELKLKLRHCNTTKKSCICLETKQIFESCKEAARQLKADKSAINSLCLNKPHNKTFKGLHFMFLEDYNKATKQEIETKLRDTQIFWNKKEVICLETKQIFESANEAGRSIGKFKNHHIAEISRDLSLKNSSRGKHWLYVDIYNKLTEKEKIELEHRLKTLTKNKKVLCIETGQIFNTVAEASRIMHCYSTYIKEACIGKRETAKKFHWKYLED